MDCIKFQGLGDSSDSSSESENELVENENCESTCIEKNSTKSVSLE